MDRKTSILVALALLLPGCSLPPRVVVASKNFTEQVILGELIAQHLERSGIEVERKTFLGGTLLAHTALEGGSIDLYPEYTGTALTAILRQPPSKDRRNVLEAVRKGYAPLGLQWLDPLGFDNTFAIVVRSETKLKTLTEAAARPQPWKIGVGYEFVQRPDGLPGLMKAYDLRLDGDPVTMDLGLLYPALRSRSIEMGAASSTDGQLADSFFTMLVDDRNYFPPYECAIVVRNEALQKFPTLRAALEKLSGRIPAEAMRTMNAAVDRQKRSAVVVVREFLEQGN